MHGASVPDGWGMFLGFRQLVYTTVTIQSCTHTLPICENRINHQGSQWSVGTSVLAQAYTKSGDCLVWASYMSQQHRVPSVPENNESTPSSVKSVGLQRTPYEFNTPGLSVSASLATSLLSTFLPRHSSFGFRINLIRDSHSMFPPPTASFHTFATPILRLQRPYPAPACDA